jgi:hypothetical protein
VNAARCGQVMVVTRDVLECTAEPSNCAGRDVVMGETFYLFVGPTYGCVGPNGVPLTDNGDEFFEFPADCVKPQ